MGFFIVFQYRYRKATSKKWIYVTMTQDKASRLRRAGYFVERV